MTTTPLVRCAICGSEFRQKTWAAERGMSRFCSKSCSNKDRRRPIDERFWSLVERRGPDECWLWTAATDRYGYGVISESLGSRSQRTQLSTHRLSYELANGPVPDGAYVLHRCDTRACVNPSHLWLGTNVDNMADMAAKGRAMHGPSHVHAKLNAPAVRQIRADYALGCTLASLARRYSVTAQSIRAVVDGETWRHVL
jgi:hypothetical protein